MNKQIVIINGSGGVGKDTFVSYCDSYVTVYNVSTMDRVKIAARSLGWDGGKTEKDRLFLSNLKLIAVGYSDHSYCYVRDCIDFFKNNQDDALLMFIHAREPQEIERFKKEFGCHTLLIKNKNVPQITSNMADSNVENYTYDFCIHNDNSVDDLKSLAEAFVVDIMDNGNLF